MPEKGVCDKSKVEKTWRVVKASSAGADALRPVYSASPPQPHPARDNHLAPGKLPRELTLAEPVLLALSTSVVELSFLTLCFYICSTDTMEVESPSFHESVCLYRNGPSKPSGSGQRKAAVFHPRPHLSTGHLQGGCSHSPALGMTLCGLLGLLRFRNRPF